MRRSAFSKAVQPFSSWKITRRQISMDFNVYIPSRSPIQEAKQYHLQLSMTQNPDLLAWKFIQASENYLKQAHQSSSQVLSSDDPSRLHDYNTLIKASLNCLFKVLRNYSPFLDARIQSILYHKTAQLLFKETISSDLALDYCTKGIQICKRNEPNLTLMKLKLQYLNFQIQFNSTFSADSKSQTLAYINNVINNEIPNDKSYLDIKIFFKFIKFKYFNSIYTNDRNILDLKNLYLQLENNTSKDNYSFKHLILINMIELQLLNVNYSMASIKENINKLIDNPDYGYKLPIQYKAMKILFDIVIALREYEYDKINEKIKEIDTFSNLFKPAQNRSKWQSKLHFNFQNNNSNGSSFHVEFNWLSYPIFSIISYFYSGLLFTIKSWNDKGKSNKIFNLVNSAIQLIHPNIPLEDIQNRDIKLTSLKILVSAYQLLADFGKDKYPLLDSNSLPSVLQKYEELSKFIEFYTANKYTVYERAIYNNLVPFMQYIFAMIYQRNGSFTKALYYYTKVRQHFSKSIAKANALSTNTTNSNTETFNDPIYVDFIQTNMGLLGSYSQPLCINNELYILSTLNSLPIIQYLIEKEKLKQKDISEFELGYDTHMKLYLNLLKIKESFITQITELLTLQTKSTDSIFKLGIQSISYFYSNNPSSSFLNDVNITDTEQVSPLLSSYLYLIMGYTYNTNHGLTELENLNLKVGYFTSACKLSTIASSSVNTNAIAKLAYLEIWKIMNNNKNLYPEERIKHVYEKYRYFSNSANKENTKHDAEDVISSSAKRVKFI